MTRARLPIRRPADWKERNPVIGGNAVENQFLHVAANGLKDGEVLLSRDWLVSVSTESPSYTVIGHAPTVRCGPLTVGKFIRLRENMSLGTQLYSEWSAAVEESGGPAPATDPVISGTPTVGFTLTLTPGSGGTGTYIGRAWVYGGAPVDGEETGAIAGETGPSWEVTDTYLDEYVAVREEWSDGYRYSNWLGPISAEVAFDPPELTVGSAPFDSWAPSTASDVGGSPTPGHDKRCSAAWLTPTAQRLDSGHLLIGVGADHINGIDRVEFVCDDGTTLAMSSRTTNPNHHGAAASGFWCKLPAASLADGRHEVRAIAYPATAGVPRILQGDIHTLANIKANNYRLEVFSNAGGTAYGYAGPQTVWAANDGNDTTGDGTEGNPYQTLYRAAFGLAGDVFNRQVGGKTILLKAGDYNLGHYSSFGTLNHSDHSWLIVRPGPGVAKAECRIVSRSGDGMKRKFLKLEGLTIRPNMKGVLGQAGGATGDGLYWCDGCDLTSPNDYEDVFDPANDATEPTGTWISGYRAGIYTGCDAVKTLATPYQGQVCVGCLVQTCADDAFKNMYTIVACEAVDIHNHGTNRHPDIWQVWRQNEPVENAYVDGLVALEDIDAQGLFFHGFTSEFVDCAFRNVEIDNGSLHGTTVFVNLHCHRPMRHVLIRDSYLRGGGLYRTGDDPETPGAHNIFSSDDMQLINTYVVQDSTDDEDFCVPNPDGAEWDGSTLPFESSLDVVYREE